MKNVNVKKFDFIPKKDVTAYELAVIANIIEFQVTSDVVARMPKKIQRHFKESK